MKIKLLLIIYTWALFSPLDLPAKDTFVPYKNDLQVPKNVVDLWKDYDPRKENLDIKVIKEWKENNVVIRYLTFTVGTFKGVPARIAAYYSFPENGLKNPAFVWSHGGGQRADRNRGFYFAQQGYATVDINWLGRPLEKDILENTDWGKVDATQGERFYSKALRKQWKTNFQPDDYSIDPVLSPRNSNWYLLALAGRRAITFLEQQPEVDKNKLGFAGYSMGGMVTSFNAIDKRLKAVAPFVGGTGFKYEDLPGIRNSSKKAQYKNLSLYKNTMDLSAYWPLVNCPVMFISSSNDFHAAFERIYKSLKLLPHKNWRVSTDIHDNHNPDPEQWILLNKWFDHYLKGSTDIIPQTPNSALNINNKIATFTVTPDLQKELISTEIYYSYDPNARTRFWNKASATNNKGTWTAKINLHNKLPLYTFAICRYKTAELLQVQNGSTNTYTLNSDEHTYMPENFEISALKAIAQENEIYEDFSQGLANWNLRQNMGISTYKFQDPELKISHSQKLKLTIETKEKDLFLISSISSRFLQPGNNIGNLSNVKKVSKGGTREIILNLKDFKFKEVDKADWRKISVFRLQLKEIGAKSNMNLTDKEWLSYLKKIEIIN